MSRILAGLSLGLLIFFIPVLPFIALLIWITEPKSPVFFKQLRIGKDKELFTIWKFRTMLVDADETIVTNNNDDRITCIGRWLRRSHLDELPQLINIMRGDMFFIGPRPLTLARVEQLEQEVFGYGKRFNVKPGLTGLMQISERDDRNSLPFDVITIRKQHHISFRIWILYKTFRKIFECSSA